MTPPRPARLRDTYEAECLCGATVESHERKATCPQCHRHLIFEWGRPALVCVDRFPEDAETRRCAMIDAREASLDWISRVLAAELATNLHEVLAEEDERPNCLLLVAENYDVPIELLIQWIQMTNLGKHWSVGEWRRWCVKYRETLDELERRERRRKHDP